MVGKRVPCPSLFATHISALFFILCFVGELADAEACGAQSTTVVHKKAGEDVELSCFQGGNVSDVKWRYNGSLVVDYRSQSQKTFYSELFKDRAYLNPTKFSLTVKNLKLNDSGEFSFVSVIRGQQQQPTVFITLQVHEALTAPLLLTSNSTWNTLNASCTHFLECRSGAAGGVAYRWTVRNQTVSGPTLTYAIGAEDGDTVFTCTVANIVSEASASTVLTCRNGTQEAAKGAGNIVLLLGAISGSVIVAAAAGTALYVCRRRRQKGLVDDQTVYADVNIAPAHLQETLPCSLYDSIDNREEPVSQTIYDKVQFKYMRDADDGIA